MAEDTIKREDYAPITQELRGRLKVAALGLSKTMADGLLAECDNIDAIHKALEQENANMRDFCERVDQAAQAREDVSLWGTDYTALPLDADGVPIHVGDVMESKVGGPLFGEGSFEVRAMRCDECGWEVYDRLGERCAPSLLRHYHKPTVEDVLREFMTEFNRDDTELCDDEIIERFAKRLQLADGDAE